MGPTNLEDGEKGVYGASREIYVWISLLGKGGPVSPPPPATLLPLSLPPPRSPTPPPLCPMARRFPRVPLPLTHVPPLSPLPHLSIDSPLPYPPHPLFISFYHVNLLLFASPLLLLLLQLYLSVFVCGFDLPQQVQWDLWVSFNPSPLSPQLLLRPPNRPLPCAFPPLLHQCLHPPPPHWLPLPPCPPILQQSNRSWFIGWILP